MKLRKILRNQIVRRKTYDKLREEKASTLEFIRRLSGSQAEYFQDLWVLNELNFLQEGFFVEFGATDGRDASNTFLLEKNFNWQGILVEPNQTYHNDLHRNRKCYIDHRIVWDSSFEEIEFLRMEKSYISVAKEDLVAETKEETTLVEKIETITLNDLLVFYNSPKTIDFLSVDIEGSELRVLETFFRQKEFDVRLMVVEHNWRKDGQEILDLVTSNGYEVVFQEYSSRDFWFRKKSM